MTLPMSLGLATAWILFGATGLSAQLSPDRELVLREGRLDVRERPAEGELLVYRFGEVSRCDLREAVTLLDAFFTAASDGDADRAMRLFPLDREGWFSVTEPDSHFDAFEPEELRAHLDMWRESGDRFRVLAVQTNDESDAMLGLGPILLDRTGPEGSTVSYTVIGKGVVDCEHEIIDRISLGYLPQGN